MILVVPFQFRTFYDSMKLLPANLQQVTTQDECSISIYSLISLIFPALSGYHCVMQAQITAALPGKRKVMSEQ